MIPPLETFFEKFDLFADCPNAVQKMRELILELAVQGKLVEQEGNDRRSIVLGDVIELISGQHLLAHEHNDEGKGIPYLTGPSDFGEHFPAPTRWTEFPKVTADPGDILITVKGAGVGKTNLLKDRKTAISRQLMAIRVIGADIAYVHLALKSAAGHFQTAMVGIAIPGIGRKDVLSLKLVLPPLAEQKRIVAKVDELMALCDALEAQQKEREAKRTALAKASLAAFAEAPSPVSLEHLFHPSYAIDPADLRKSILTLAVQGKLVEQRVEEGDIDSLLVQIWEERRAICRADYRLNDSDGPGLGFDVPSSWGWSTLEGILIDGPTNGFSPKSVEYETPVKSLTLSATTSGKFRPEFSKFIADPITDDSDLWLQNGDILVQRGNTIEYVGVPAVYYGTPKTFIYPDLMMRVRVATCLDVGFIHLAMSAESSRDYLRSRASGTSGSMPKINQSTLKSLPIPLPPLAEQKRIVAKVDELMALVDRLEAQEKAAQEKGARLLEAMVAELSGRAA